MDTTELTLRLTAAAVAGAVLGLERQFGSHNAGIRTHTLVSLGACVFTVIGAYGFSDIPRGSTADPARVAAQVVSGVGFLGAGAILRDGGSVRGLTTAATLWIAAALGVAAASGAYAITGATVVLVLVVLAAVRVARSATRRLPGRRCILAIEYDRGHGTLGPVLRALSAIQAEPRRVQIIDDEPRDDLLRGHGTVGNRRVEIVVRARAELLEQLVSETGQRPEVHSVSIGR